MTIYDIAKEAGVSPATVSRVINNSGFVKLEKRLLIEEVIKKHDFTPNSFAKALKSKDTNTIACIVSNITYQFYSQLFYSLQLEASKYGYVVFLLNTDDDFDNELNSLKIMMDKRVDAIVFMGGSIESEVIDNKYLEKLKLVATTIPIVTIVKRLQLDCIQVYQDNDNGMFCLLEHIKSLGYIDAYFLCLGTNPIAIKERIKYFLLHCKTLNINTKSDNIISLEDASTKFEEVKNIITNVKRKTALCCFNDILAVEIINIANEINTKVPDLIGICGYDSTFDSTITYPKLTTVEHDFNDYGKIIFQETNKAIKSNKLTDHSKIIINANLKIRNSL